MLRVMVVVAPHKTADSFLDAHLRELSGVSGRSAYTIRNYRTDIGHFLRWCEEHARDPLTITRHDFREYLGELRASAAVLNGIKSLLTSGKVKSISAGVHPTNQIGDWMVEEVRKSR